jgi:K+ potassium transporter C-terminal domain
MAKADRLLGLVPSVMRSLFIFTARNAVRATSFFRIPPERVVEIGIQVEAVAEQIGQPGSGVDSRSNVCE